MDHQPSRSSQSRYCFQQMVRKKPTKLSCFILTVLASVFITLLMYMAVEESSLRQFSWQAINDGSSLVKSFKAKLDVLERSIQTSNRKWENMNLTNMCRMKTCFDYSKCPLVGGFPVFIYKQNEKFSNENLNEFVKSSLSNVFNKSPYVTYKQEKACVFIAVFGELSTKLSESDLQNKIKSLEYWNGDGRNHVLLNIARNPSNRDIFKDVNTGMAIIAQSAFTGTLFRRNFDVVIPPTMESNDGPIWKELPPLSPVRRPFLLSFIGKFKDSKNLLTGEISKQTNNVIDINDSGRLLYLESLIVQSLNKIRTDSKDKVYINLNCGNGDGEGIIGEWCLCDSASERKKILLQSTFSIMIAPVNYKIVSTTVFQARLQEALKHGAIPVILGDQVELPFNELIDWRKAAIFLPEARVTELSFILGTFSDNDIMEYKFNGRMFWETYLGTTNSIISTMLSVLRTRLLIPPIAVKEEPSINSISKFTPVQQNNAKTEEVLGPIEPPFPSIKFTQNFTTRTLRDVFHRPGDPFHLFPYDPFVNVLPSDAKFKGSRLEFQPINKGSGGSGKYFRQAIGGNYPKEQFTIIIETYKRNELLIQTLTERKGLPFLNKVVVVWNNPEPPPDNLGWPDIGVPIVVIKSKKNSLNNRFLPFESIETEAIFSMDDDIRISNDEIVFGFRVWREERDRLVGIPGRIHSYDEKRKTWFYDLGALCETSIVLTGAAFFHKYYSYLYSYSMPQAIRDKVDEFMNCEDIAMAFLTSHISRKPPVKITTRRNFSCSGCGKGLSADPQHMNERNECLNFFAEVYGYMPLLYTQYIAQSTLYNTKRSENAKCFRNL